MPPLILRTQKLGETDRIIIMLTRDNGITHAVAKAVRKPTSKFGGRLEPFMHTDLSFSRGRTNLHTITQAATLHAYTAPIMANYDAYTCASTHRRTGGSTHQRHRQHRRYLHPDPRGTCRARARAACAAEDSDPLPGAQHERRRLAAHR